ncbi:HIG1 domain family member 2A, mitochondrial-like [Gigantopelta aegis]|uniref:HIG1 domain family member 2A, mitochondrial-like n=1 Tax=Gigantopelta aegis TaxID=1735272 RepID=UPI001B88E299|nr:HIG1 domain family member 2A, mitochondrial-like [Gigantopelta aegis]
MVTTAAQETEEFAYLPPPTHDASIYKQEGVKEKLIRKTKQNPFVVVGIALTTFALTYGIYQLKTGNRQVSQSMMRLRIVAQGSTVLAVLGGVFYGAKTQGTKK